MKLRILALLTLFTVIVGTMAGGQKVTHAATASGNEPPLRLSEPVDAVVADLEAYIPQRLREANVPGLSIALIRDGQIAWTEGFGVANTLTRKPVTSETAFEVASISKAVAAYTALQLVQQGVMSLDEPVTSFLSAPWLPPSDYGDKITLRHLLTHSSGLTNQVDTVDKSVTFRPGATFSYSGVGFIYLQEIIERATGRGLEEIAREATFEPLGMSLSSYVNNEDVRAHLANGHVNYGSFLSNFAMPFAVMLVGTTLVGVIVRRFRKGNWALSWQMLAASYIIAAGLALLAAALILEGGALKWLVLGGLWALTFGVALALVSLTGRLVIRRLPGLRDARERQRTLTLSWTAIGVIGLLVITGLLTGPVPKGLPAPANAAYSLRATASDLASFLIELSHPRLLDPDLAAQMCTPQIRVNKDNSWGLGIGIQHSRQGNSLWHGGDNPDFHSLMVVYPEHKIGVVVLTNGHQGGPVTYDVAQRALGGAANWSSRK
jgi:CubicO group peptidase (beta-lactamase class C family)